MKVVLATAKQKGMVRQWLPPLALAYVAATLEAEGIEVEIVDSQLLNYDAQEAARAILSKSPDAVGITATTHNRFEAINICNAVKEQADPLVFVGGPHFTLTAHDALQNIKSIDAVVRGEGELTVPELIQAYLRNDDLSAIPGLSFKDKDGNIIENPDRPLISDLDSIPMPAYHLFKLEKYTAVIEGKFENRRAIGVVSSRGCPHNCSFCVNGSLWGRKFRRRDPKKFVDEIEFIYNEYGYDAFDIWDDTITVVKQHLVDICNEIINRKLPIIWYARSRVDCIDQEILVLMKKAGCINMGFGIESGSPRMLEKINKRTTVEEIKSTIKMAADLGFNIRVFFMLSLPEETEADSQATLELIEELCSYGKNVISARAFTTIFPGTKVEEMAIAQAEIFPADFSWNTYHEFSQSNILQLFGGDPTVPFFVQPNLAPEKLYAQMVALHKWSFADWVRRIFVSLGKTKNLEQLGIKAKRLLTVITQRVKL